MSVAVMTEVWKRFDGTGGLLLLALALADHANPDGTHIHPGLDTLIANTRQSRRTVQYQLKKLCASGWLIPVAYVMGGSGRATEYRINPDWLKGANSALLLPEKGADIAPFQGEKGATDDKKGATDDKKGATAIAPQRINRLEPSYITSLLRNLVLPDGITRELAAEVVEYRTKTLKSPLTQRSLAAILKNLLAAGDYGLSPEQALTEWQVAGWKGFEVEWLVSRKRKGVQHAETGKLSAVDRSIEANAERIRKRRANDPNGY